MLRRYSKALWLIKAYGWNHQDEGYGMMWQSCFYPITTHTPLTERPLSNDKSDGKEVMMGKKSVCTDSRI